MKILDKITAFFEELFFGKLNRDNKILHLESKLRIEESQQEHLKWRADFYKNLYNHYEKLSSERFTENMGLLQKLWDAENKLRALEMQQLTKPGKGASDE